MHDQEGVIKYQLNHQFCSLPPETDISELNAWRRIFYQLKLIGLIPGRYDNLGFGNISRRWQQNDDAFLISGTQTGGLSELELSHYALIHYASPLDNHINSSGLQQPSSEALTHASVYQHDATTQAVIHVHSPIIWRHTQTLGLAHIESDIPYGTMEMALAVADLFTSGVFADRQVFTMLGHLDGVVGFGTSLCEAGCQLIAVYAKGLAIANATKSK
jgi:L-ribulose-5-phosphate 4-epimerase